MNTEPDWEKLSEVAWRARENARIIGKTKVGAAAQSEIGRVYSGCNIEHRFRCHDIHAEINAISSLVSDGNRKLVAILIVAERERFTPCGGCMDWIFEFGGGDCLVGFQSEKGSSVQVYRSAELMPFYPQ